MTGRTGIISALLAVAALGLWLVCGRGVAKEAVYPVENGRSWFSRTVGVRLGGLFHGARVAAENQELRRQVARLSVLLSDMQRIAEENDRLRAMLSLDARDHGLTTNGWICADVISRAGAGGVRNLIRVGRGSDHGVKVGAAVAAPEGLVGRVEQVSARTADIRLLTDPSVKVSCFVATNDPETDRLDGILNGGDVRVRTEAGASLLYVLPLRINHLRRGPVLPSRARVITSGLGGVYPSGLTAGFLVDGQDTDENQLERECGVIPAVDFSALEDVFIRRED